MADSKPPEPKPENEILGHEDKAQILWIDRGGRVFLWSPAAQSELTLSGAVEMVRRGLGREEGSWTGAGLDRFLRVIVRKLDESEF